MHGFSPSTPSTTSVDSYSSQLLWEARAQIRRSAGPGLRGGRAAPARPWGAIPGGEGNLEGDRGGGCVDRSCLQQPTAWGDLEGHGGLIWLLLACRMGRTRRQLHAPPAALTPASWRFCCCPPPRGGDHFGWGKWPSAQQFPGGPAHQHRATGPFLGGLGLAELGRRA